MLKHLKMALIDLLLGTLMYMFLGIPLYFSLFVFADGFLTSSVFKDDDISKEMKILLFLAINIIGWGCELFFDVNGKYFKFDIIITILCFLGLIEKVIPWRIMKKTN